MKLLINCSDLRGTGVCQVAASFLNECCAFNENEYVVFIAEPVKKNIDIDSFPSNFKFYEFENKALFSLAGWPNIIKMKKIEAKEKPDCTFTVFGPSFWRPKSPHLQGYAYPHYVYPESPLFNLLSFKQRIDIKIRQWLHVTQLKRNGDFFVCETEDVKKRWSSMYGIPEERVFKAYNTASEPFFSYAATNNDREDDEFRFYSLCSPYRHKNLEILNDVCELIPALGIKKDIKFYTTLPEDSVTKIFREETRKYIVNVGPQLVADCPKLVAQCDALFLPTLLECYSASYPEAMCMGKPILTSNLSFATDVCDNAALYFNPLDANDIIKKIGELIESPDLYSELQARGKERLKEFGRAHDRAQIYLGICKTILNKSH